MRFFLFLFFIDGFAIKLIDGFAIGQTQIADGHFATIVRGLEFVYNLEFDSADAIFDRLIEASPDHPRGYFFKSSASFYRIVSGSHSERLQEEYVSRSEEAIRIAEVYGEQEKHEIEADFYLGAVYGNLGRYYAARGDWIKAFYYGRKTKSLHRRVIERDSTVYDAYLSLGLYNYYAATLPRFVDMVASLFGLDGNREEGLTQLRMAEQKGVLAAIEGKFFLANVYTEEGNYEEALRLYDELCRRFSVNPYLFGQRGVVKYKMDDFEGAVVDFEESIRLAGDTHESAVMTASYYLGRIHKVHNDFTGAIGAFRHAFETGEKLNLFKTVDGWTVGAAYYHTAEALELSGNRQFAVQFYELGKNHPMSTKGTVEGCKARLKSGLSAFEIRLIHARHDVLVGRLDRADTAFTRLKEDAFTDDSKRRFLASIHYYQGRIALARRSYADARTYFESALESDGLQNDVWIEPHARYYLGLVLRSMKMNREAKAQWQKALTFNNYPEEARIRFQAERNLAR